MSWWRPAAQACLARRRSEARVNHIWRHLPSSKTHCPLNSPSSPHGYHFALKFLFLCPVSIQSACKHVKPTFPLQLCLAQISTLPHSTTIISSNYLSWLLTGPYQTMPALPPAYVPPPAAEAQPSSQHGYNLQSLPFVPTPSPQQPWPQALHRNPSHRSMRIDPRSFGANMTI